MQDAALLELGSRVLAAARGGGRERYAPKPQPAECVAAARAALSTAGEQRRSKPATQTAWTVPLQVMHIVSGMLLKCCVENQVLGVFANTLRAEPDALALAD